MRGKYKIPLIKELRDQQVRFAPKDKKIEQMERAERLFYEINTTKRYSYKYIYLSITDFRPELNGEEIFSGEDVKDDLLFFLNDLADSVVIPVENAAEMVWTVEQLGERFHVSTKTVARWREAGLISRRFLIDGKKRVGFLSSSVETFVKRNPERVKRGEQFSQLSEEERSAIIERAKRLSELGGNSTEVAKELSGSTGRSVETIRYTLKAFDEANAENALFPNRNSPLREETKWKIYQGFRRGETIEDLACKYNRTKGSIYRIVGHFRGARIFEIPLEFIDSPEFQNAEKSRLDAVFTAPTPKSPTERSSKRGRKPVLRPPIPDESVVGPEVFQEPASREDDLDGLPPYLVRLYEVPLLTAEQEIHLFRKMNYLKFKASALRSSLEPEKPKAHVMSRIEEYYEQAVEAKNEIVSANLRLVVSIAKKHISPFAGFFELVSDGNLSLMKAVEKFDYTRGNKFSTYATWAIMRNFARTIPDEKKYRDRFHPSETEIFDSTEDFRTFLTEEEKIQHERLHLVGHLLEELTDREQQIIVSRYGLGKEDISPRTLRQIGADLEVTKERVRQIEIRALAKLRRVVEEEQIDIP